MVRAGPTLSVAVNLSPLQIRDRWLVDLVADIMAETGIAASRVVLEVTEGVLIDNPQEAQARLEALRALGVRLRARRFRHRLFEPQLPAEVSVRPAQDRPRFRGVARPSGNTGAIIQSIVTLGHALGMKVLAEGVENDEQRVLLRLAGCDEMQGFLFAMPGAGRGNRPGSARRHASPTAGVRFRSADSAPANRYVLPRRPSQAPAAGI